MPVTDRKQDTSFFAALASPLPLDWLGLTYKTPDDGRGNNTKTWGGHYLKPLLTISAPGTGGSDIKSAAKVTEFLQAVIKLFGGNCELLESFKATGKFIEASFNVNEFSTTGSAYFRPSSSYIAFEDRYYIDTMLCGVKKTFLLMGSIGLITTTLQKTSPVMMNTLSDASCKYFGKVGLQIGNFPLSLGTVRDSCFLIFFLVEGGYSAVKVVRTWNTATTYTQSAELCYNKLKTIENFGKVAVITLGLTNGFKKFPLTAGVTCLIVSYVAVSAAVQNLYKNEDTPAERRGPPSTPMRPR